MKRFVMVALSVSLLAGVALAEEGVSKGKAEETIPKTVEGGSRTAKEGGKEIGAGFRGIGRGVKKMFTGKRSKEDFQEGKKIGEGFRDLGRGTAGVGRGVGRGVKKGVTGSSDTDDE